jgi:hypothetical protein
LEHVLSLCHHGIDRPSSSPTAAATAASSSYHRHVHAAGKVGLSGSISHCDVLVNKVDSSGRTARISDLIQAICNDDITKDLSTTITAIRNAIIDENKEIESKISIFHDLINGEAESRTSRPTSSMGWDHHSSGQRPQLANKEIVMNIVKQNSSRVCNYCGRESTFEEAVDGKALKLSYTCALCKDLERNERKQMKSSTSKVSASTGILEESIVNTSANAVDDAEISHTKIGKFRGRLQSARDEKYFFEDL